MLDPLPAPRRARLRAFAVCLLGAAVAWAPGRIGAAERLPVSFERPGAVGLRWGAGVCEPRTTRGSSWVRCNTEGHGEPVFVAAERFPTPHDLRGDFVKIWVRARQLPRLAGLELRLSSDDFATSYFAFEVPLFADPHFGLLQEGTWIPLTFSFGGARVVGTPDRAAIDSAGFFFRDAATGPVELSWSELAAQDQASDGRLSLTFDDGLAAHHRVAAREMARFGFRGTAYVMPDQIGRAGFMTLAQLHELRDRYGWEVAAHYDLPLTELRREELEPTLLGVQGFLRRHGFAEGADHLAFPLGRQDPGAVLPAVRRRFRTARLASAGPETIPPADPHRLRVLNVLDTTSPEAIGAAAGRARAHGEWLILMFHHLVPTPESELEYGIQTFVRALERIRASGIRVRPLGETWREIETREPAPVPAKPTFPRP